MSCHIFWQETRKQSPNTSLWRGVKVNAVVTLVTQISKHPSIYLSHRALYVLLSNNDQEVQDLLIKPVEVWVGCSCVCVYRLLAKWSQVLVYCFLVLFSEIGIYNDWRDFLAKGSALSVLLGSWGFFCIFCNALCIMHFVKTCLVCITTVWGKWF